MQFKKIITNINLLNIMLILTGLLFAFHLSPLFAMKVKYALPPAKKFTEAASEKTSQPQTPSIAEYAVISEENLFHPERRIPPEKKEAAPLPKPDFVLFGTLISDDLRLAYLEDLKAPRSTAGRGKRHTALKKGDAMSGFTLKEIEADKIVMVRGEEKIIVSINDTAHPKMRESQGTVAQATVQKPVPATVQQRGPANVQQPASTPAARAGQKAAIQQPSVGTSRRIGEGFGGRFRSPQR
jgi:type II secretory pathway component PulC